MTTHAMRSPQLPSGVVIPVHLGWASLVSVLFLILAVWV